MTHSKSNSKARNTCSVVFHERTAATSAEVTTLDSICILHILVLLPLFQNILSCYHINTKQVFQSSVPAQNLNTIHRVYINYQLLCTDYYLFIKY